MLALAVNVVFLALAACVVIFYICMIAGFWYGAPFVPTSYRTVSDMISLARIVPGDVIYDLGSGDGRILIAAARAGGDARGWEIHPMLVWLARLKAQWAGVGRRVRVERANFWNADWRCANVIMVYLITARMQELKEKLTREAQSGTRVVSHAFRIPGWEVVEERGEARLYVVP